MSITDHIESNGSLHIKLSMKPPRKSNEQPIKEAIEAFLDTYHLRDKLNQATLIESWDKVVGEMISRNTSQLHIRKKTLYVKVNSAALRNELLFARSKLIQELNRKAGAAVIDEIVFT